MEIAKPRISPFPLWNEKRFFSVIRIPLSYTVDQVCNHKPKGQERSKYNGIAPAFYRAWGKRSYGDPSAHDTVFCCFRILNIRVDQYADGTNGNSNSRFHQSRQQNDHHNQFRVSSAYKPFIEEEKENNHHQPEQEFPDARHKRNRQTYKQYRIEGLVVDLTAFDVRICGD